MLVVRTVEVITKFKFSGYIGQAVGRTEMMALEMEMLTAKPGFLLLPLVRGFCSQLRSVYLLERTNS